jgi:hypothetical protein
MKPVRMPVKLRIAHVPELIHLCGKRPDAIPSPFITPQELFYSCGTHPAGAGDILRHISARQIAPSAVPLAIDETRSLPYKPRQLSAMIRLVRGGSIFGPAAVRFGPSAHRSDILDNLIRQIAGWQLAGERRLNP